MNWVWRHSSSKGTARMVLLAVANWCPDPTATAYAGTTLLMRYTHASRSGVRAAIDKLIETKELEIVENAKGPRGETVYCLPHAAKSSPSTRSRAGTKPSESDPGQENTPRGAESRCPEGQTEEFRGAESAPLNAKNQEEHKEPMQPRAQQSEPITSDELHRLASALEAAGVSVRWNLGQGEQQEAQGLIERHGVDAVVARTISRTRLSDPPKPARYWLRVWSDLDRGPRYGNADVIPLHAAASRSHRDSLAAGLALYKAQEGLA